MPRSLWRITPITIVGIVTLIISAGCSHQTAQNPTPTAPRVAGTQEHYANQPVIKPGYAPLVVVTFTDKGITVVPNRIPPGTFNVKFVNGSSHAQTLSLSGKGISKTTQTLKPGDGTTITVQNLQPGEYKIGNIKGPGVKHHDTEIKVAKGAPLPATSTPIPNTAGTPATTGAHSK